jgi:hypothetical protein
VGGGDWLLKDWSMALSSGRGEAVENGARLGEVSTCAVKEFIALLTDNAGTGNGNDVEVSEVDGAGRMFCGAANTGVAFIVNHSESCGDVVRNGGWKFCHGILRSRSPKMSSGAVVPSESIKSARHISFSTSSSCSGLLLPRAIDIYGAHSGKTNDYNPKTYLQ